MLEIFSFDFMLRAFAAGLLMALVAPVVGVFLVVRRYALFADTLAHVALAGLAIGILSNIYPLGAALLFAVAAALGIELLRAKKKIFGEAVLAVFLSGSLAIAAVLLSFARGPAFDLFAFLFGSILTVSPQDLLFMLSFGSAILLITALLAKEFFFVSLDEEFAKISGRKARIINFLLIIIVAVVVTLSIRVVGVLLVGALTVIPVVAAMQIARNFFQTFFFSIAIALVSVISGLFLSYYFDLASGGTIVVVALLFLIFSLLLKRK
jgi:zinc transport system permease protein